MKTQRKATPSAQGGGGRLWFEARQIPAALGPGVWALVWGTLLVSLLLAVPVRPARAAPYVADATEELTEKQLAFAKVSGLESYAVLREIWGAWEETDPRKVEEALLLAAANQRKPPQVRAYAEVLSAYARRRRGDLAGSQEIFDELGFVTDWLIVGPFDNEGKAGFDREFGPEAELSEPLVPGRAYSGKERPVRWRTLPQVFEYGWVDLGAVLRPQVHMCAYATTFVTPGEEGKRATVWAGSQGALRLWVNGEPALKDDAYRGFDVDRMGTTVRLRSGWNRLTVKVCGSDDPPLFSVRLADRRGRVDEDLVLKADVALSEAARDNIEAARADDRPEPRHPRRLRAPLDLLEEASGEKASAAELQTATRYMVFTGSDDEAEHLARDLATRAADQEPTVERHLWVAQLAEDRNAARRAIEKAEAIAERDDVEVLLARAQHLRSGPNPLEAFALYDRILAIDPLHLTALRGRVELYNAAGLRRTALAALEAAYEKRPHSVLLSNMVASQREALGRSVEATEAENRYAALRFDDTSYMTSRMEVALERRNEQSAQHWLSRIVGVEPDNLWSYRLAARVHRAMGQQKRARVDLERAREIAPEDVGVLRHLADLEGRAGNRDEQVALLTEVLRLRPQQVDVRKYVEHIEPPEVPADEKYAMPAEEFLKLRHRPANGHTKRTLRDLTVSTVYDNGLGTSFRQVVFQPMTDSAAAMSRQYAFQYQADRQRVQLKGARVYRTDGSVDEAIESGEGAADDPSVSMYTSARTYYVQFPRLEPGDVVELRYRIDDVTPRNEFDDYYGDIVYMQSTEPVFRGEYVLVTPKSRKLKVDAHVPGLKKSVKERDDQRVYRFVANDIPAIQPEPSMPPWPEILGFVHVSTYESWDALGKWYWGLVREQLDLDKKTRELVHEITKGKKTDLEKVKAVYGWVVNNTRYVALEFGIYGYKPRRCVQTVARGWGDCKDKATVIVTLLRELGIDARLVVVRTQNRGDFDSKLPSLAPFDHAIAYVPSLDLYLDGTAEHAGTFELPVMDHQALGLHILDGKAKLERLPAPDPQDNVIQRDVGIFLRKDGSAKLDLEYRVEGYAAPGFRDRYEADSTRRDRLASDLGKSYPGLEIAKGGIDTSDLSDIEAPVMIGVDGKAPQYARKEGNALSLPVTVSTRLTPSYASLSSRKLDLRIVGFSTQKEKVTVKLPPGMDVVRLPPEVEKETPFGRYSVSVEKKNGQVVVESELALKVTRVSPKQYAAFRKFAVAADQALAHRLVVQP